MPILVLMMSWRQIPENGLDQRATAVCEVGEGWKGTEEMGGKRRWVLRWAEGGWDTLLGKVRVAFPKPDRLQKAQAHPVCRSPGGGALSQKHWTSSVLWKRTTVNHMGLVHPRARRKKPEQQQRVISCAYLAPPDAPRTRNRTPQPWNMGYRAALRHTSAHHRCTGISSRVCCRRRQQTHPLPLANHAARDV